MKSTVELEKPTTRLSSTETAVAVRCMEAIRRASPAKGWWASREGRNARRHLELWGAVIRHRLASGDISSLPRISSKNISWQGASDSMPALAMVHATVDRFVGSLPMAARKLLHWVYVVAMEEQAVISRYQLADGSWSDPCLTTDPEPTMAWDQREDLQEAFVATMPIEKFPAKVILMDGAAIEFGKAGITNWQRLRTAYLASVHEDLAKDLAGILAE